MNYAELERLARKEAGAVHGTRVGRIKRFVVESCKVAWENIKEWETPVDVMASLAGVLGGFFLVLSGVLWILLQCGVTGSDSFPKDLDVKGITSACVIVVAWLIFWIPAAVRVGRIMIWPQKEMKALAQLVPSEVAIPRMRERLVELERELLGEGSRYRAHDTLVRERHAQALRLREQIDMSLRENNAEFMRDLRKRVDDAAIRLGMTLSELNGFRAKVETYLASVRSEIAGLDPVLQRLGLVREAEKLVGQVPELVAEATALIDAAVEKIERRMVCLRTDVEECFLDHGIPLSDLLAINPEPAREHDALRALAELDQRIENFNPEALREMA
ncbi:MAG: hypothetical protein WC654_01280 [Patescibacteria group bacterium]